MGILKGVIPTRRPRQHFSDGLHPLRRRDDLRQPLGQPLESGAPVVRVDVHVDQAEALQFRMAASSGAISSPTVRTSIPSPAPTTAGIL